MVMLASAARGGATAREAIAAALEAATEGARGARPALAVVFVSADYPDLDEVGAALAPLRDIPIVGGISASYVITEDARLERGCSVLLLSGDDIRVCSRVARPRSADLVELVGVAEEIAAAAAAVVDELPEFAALVFGPSLAVDGEALVSAVRKGAGVRAKLAGCLTGDDTVSPGTIFVGHDLRDDHVSITGLFTRRPLGIAARHGWRAVGRIRKVTRTDGVRLLELDGRRALDVWLEDVRAAGGAPPAELHELAVYLTHHFPIGLADEPRGRVAAEDPLVVRAPYAVDADGALRLAGAIADGTPVRLVAAHSPDMLRAASDAAEAAVRRAGQPVAGALVMACASRAAALGEAFVKEPVTIHDQVGAPLAGGCVYGEIARDVTDVDAFFNTTTVVVAFPR